MGRQCFLLTLPLEIRMLIYEIVLEPDVFDFVDPTYTLTDQRHSARRIEGFNIVSVGTAPHRERDDLQRLARQQHDPWALVRICQQVRHETARKLAAVSLDNVFFSFYGFTSGDMSAWVERVAPHREQMQCYRAVSVSLNTMNAELKEHDDLVLPHSRTSDAPLGFHHDHHIGVRDAAVHLHRELVGVQCNLELLQGCLDAEEQFMVKNDSSSAGGSYAHGHDQRAGNAGYGSSRQGTVQRREAFVQVPRRGSCQGITEF
ncbi:hypothetical protein ACCO45_012786 [Purpureocillium lilacinum]|uniref:Uncharacterized protein n=1 Tax=Purpureocillium lilacinum TaxID=33203 RepID=A0ACC4D9P3_PURLI